MKNGNATLVALFTSMTLVACGSSPDAGSAEVTQWLGEATHLAISGTLQGHTYNVHLEGDKASGVYCNRFYTPLPGTQPDAQGGYDTSQVYFVMKELGAVIDVDGTPKEFTISYWRHDVAAGTDLTVIPRVFYSEMVSGSGLIPEGKTWSDVNLFDPGGSNLIGLETAAASGTVSMKLNTGVPDEGHVMVPTGGRTGEFISVSWGPNEALKISATADCFTVPANATVWAQSRIKP